MIQKEINGRMLLFVEVEKDSREHQIIFSPVRIMYWSNSGNNYLDTKPLAKGSYSIIGLASELTEWDWEGIVEGNNGGQNDTMWYDYTQPKTCFFCFTKTTATESGLSLLSSLGLNKETTLIILKEKVK